MEKLVFVISLVLSSSIMASSELGNVSPTVENDGSNYMIVSYDNNGSHSSTFRSDGSSSETYQIGNETVIINSNGTSSSTFSIPTR